jgi:hypothetical protein
VETAYVLRTTVNQVLPLKTLDRQLKVSLILPALGNSAGVSPRPERDGTVGAETSREEYRLIQQPKCPEPSGAHDRIRTGDLVLTKDTLCHLSYVGACAD